MTYLSLINYCHWLKTKNQITLFWILLLSQFKKIVFLFLVTTTIFKKKRVFGFLSPAGTKYILRFLIITFADTIGVSEDGTFFYGSKRGKHHTYITFTVFFGYHTNEQFPFWKVKKKWELTKVHLKNREVMVPSGWSMLSNRYNVGQRFAFASKRVELIVKWLLYFHI